MAKPKKYISSKLKVKRKFVTGGPYSDVESELYLGKNTYSADMAPTNQMQAQANLEEQQQRQAQQVYNQNQNRLQSEQSDLTAMQNAERQRAEEERKQKEAEDAANKKQITGQATKGAQTFGKELAKDYLQNQAITQASTNAALKAGTYYSPTWASTTPALTAESAGYVAPTLVDPAMQTAATTTGELMPGAATVGQNLATTQGGNNLATNVATNVVGKTGEEGAKNVIGTGVGESAKVGANVASKGLSYGSTAANVGVGIGLGLAGEGVGYWATHRQDKIDKGRGYSQYYSDTHYTNREAAGQLGKSTLKGAGMGSAFGPVGTAVGAGVGLLYGIGKVAHEKRQASGKNWFGESNVYDENKDPNVIAARNYEKSLEAQKSTASQMDNAFLSSRVQKENTGHGLTNTIMARTGGKIEYLKGGIAKSLGRGAKEYVGKKHEQGGIDLPGNIEVEGGETEQNNYIFSATLKLPTGISYAQAHKNLLKSGASPEEIKQLALSQETAAGRNPNEIKTMKFAKYGGPLTYDNGGPKSSTNQESNYKQQLSQALTSSGLSAEEFAKQNGIDVGLLNDVISGNKTLTADEASLLGAAITTKPVNSTGYMVPVDDKGNPKSTPTANSNPDAPTINNQLSTFENIAKTAGALDYTSPDAAGGIWAGDKYENEWKPLVARTMRDDVNADKVIAYLENYSGQDAADVKARIAGKSRDEQIKIINKLATDKQVGPFHNAVLEGIKSTEDYTRIKPLEPKPFPREVPTLKFNTTKPETPLPNLPEYKDPNLAWAQAIPAVVALGTNVKPAQYAPALASQYVQPGSVGKVNIGRVQFNEQRNDLRANTAAMNQALQNMSGPGAVAGMLAAKTKSDQQSLAIANAEQNQNMGLAAKEAELNAGISKFNVGTGLQAETTNAGIGVQNAAMQNESRKFNAASKFQADIDNRDTKLSAGQHAIDSYLTYDMDKRKLAATERVARAQDYSGALYREEVFNKAKRASQDPNNKDFYGKSDAELWDYTRKYDTRMHGERGNVIYADADKNNQDQKKFGGAKKYISRLGDLKNAKYKV